MTRLYAIFRLLVIGVFLLTSLPTKADQYIFRPSKAHALYSDTSNWENRVFPGTYLSSSDSIFFFKGSADSIHIDLSLTVDGYIIIREGVFIIIDETITVRNFNNYTSITSYPGAYIRIDGILDCKDAPVVLGGIIDVLGTIYTTSNYHYYYGKYFLVDTLRLKGLLQGYVTFISGKRLESQGTMVIENDPLEENFKSFISFDEMVNIKNLAIGYDDTKWNVDKVINYGFLQCNASFGAVENMEDAYMDWYPVNGFSDIAISSIKNEGTIDINRNRFGVFEKLTIQDSLINRGEMTLNAGINLASVNGSFYNKSTIWVKGAIRFATTNAINDSLMTIQDIPANETGGAVISGNFLNRGELKIYGRLTILGAFTNQGTLLQFTQ